MKRRWFQIHLSTILFVTVFAGALLGVNMCDRDVKAQYQGWYAKQYKTLYTWGWPFELGLSGTYGPPAPVKGAVYTGDRIEDMPFRDYDSNYVRYAIYNGMACFGICVMVATICEFVIRGVARVRAGRYD